PPRCSARDPATSSSCCLLDGRGKPRQCHHVGRHGVHDSLASFAHAVPPMGNVAARPSNCMPPNGVRLTPTRSASVDSLSFAASSSRELRALSRTTPRKPIWSASSLGEIDMATVADNARTLVSALRLLVTFPLGQLVIA